MTRGLADVSELFITGSSGDLDATIQSLAKDVAAQSSPAEVVAGLTERFIDSAGRSGSEQVSAPRLTRAVRHFVGSVSGSVFDPACGIGSMLLAFGSGHEVTLAGQEANPSAARHLAEYMSTCEAVVGRLHELLGLLPPLTSGPGSLDGATLKVADLARAGL